MNDVAKAFAVLGRILRERGRRVERARVMQRYRLHPAKISTRRSVWEAFVRSQKQLPHGRGPSDGRHKEIIAALRAMPKPGDLTQRDRNALKRVRRARARA